MLKDITNNARIAVIQEKVSRIQKDIEDIKVVLKEGYATKDSLVEVAKDVEKRLVALEASRNLWSWLNPLLAGTLGSVLTFLLVQYLMAVR